MKNKKKYPQNHLKAMSKMLLIKTQKKNKNKKMKMKIVLIKWLNVLQYLHFKMKFKIIRH